jgi:hypothetical protein
MQSSDKRARCPKNIIKPQATDKPSSDNNTNAWALEITAPLNNLASLRRNPPPDKSALLKSMRH